MSLQNDHLLCAITLDAFGTNIPFSLLWYFLLHFSLFKLPSDELIFLCMFIIITQDDYMMQVALQPAMECLPLVMEPESNFYQDPVVILDFQSLYPSMIIAYNLCYSTCLGKVPPSKTNVLGVSSYSADALLKNLNEQLLTPNGVMYVPSKVSF